MLRNIPTGDVAAKRGDALFERMNATSSSGDVAVKRNQSG